MTVCPHCKADYELTSTRTWIVVLDGVCSVYDTEHGTLMHRCEVDRSAGR